MIKKYHPVILAIIDGFGVPKERSIPTSTWGTARQPNFAELEKFYPFTTLQASGIAVGLPWGEPGNSEVGHLTIGAGKIIHNYLPRISSAISDGTFFQNEAFLNAIKHAKDGGGRLHFMGLFSTGTVHAYFGHLYALLDLTKQNNIGAELHLFTDGKDAYKKEGGEFFAKLEKDLSENYPNAKISSVIGRDFAMDRNGDWSNTRKAYELFTERKGVVYGSASACIKSQYENGVFDTEIKPCAVGATKASDGISDNDSVVFFNFREDSARQLTNAFMADDFVFFPRKRLENLYFVTMTEYDKGLPCFSGSGSCQAAFKSAMIENPLARVISENDLTQLHIAETEKYAHITYFFNGGTENSFSGENRMLVPSPDDERYDATQEISVNKVTENILANMGKYDFIVANFANTDTIGHTGNFEATVRAIEKVDECLGRIATKALEAGGAMIITADHGNAEEKIYKVSGEKKTKHSTNPVPFFLVGDGFKRPLPLNKWVIDEKYKQTLGTLSDVAPTILELLDLEIPAEMTGKSLIKKIL